MSKTISNSNEFQEDKYNVMARMGSFWAGALVVDRVAHLGCGQERTHHGGAI